MTNRFKKGAATAGIITLITGGGYGIVLGWNNVEINSLGKQGAQSAAAFDAMKENYEKQSALIEKISTSQDEMKIQIARQGVILDLISPQLGVNPGVADAKIKREASSTQ